MSKKTIFIGNQSNDGTGDSIREAFNKANQNFDELYSIAGAGSGLFFTKNLEDTPKSLIADTITNASSIIGVNTIGNSLTNKLLIGSTGISIVSTGSSIYIVNESSSLVTDPAPALGGNLDGNNFRATQFADPIDPKDLATKDYVDNNSFASSVNLYVSTSGVDSRTGPAAGRSLAQAYRSISKACQVAEEIINTSPLELGPDQKYITYGLSYLNKSSIQQITTSTNIPGNVVIKVNYTGDGTDAWIQKDIRPGQYIKGTTSGAIGFVEYLSNVGNSSPRYESYDLRLLTNQTFVLGEELLYGTPVVLTNITILIESGIYEEQYPIKVPTNVSLRGDEFRRVIVRPAAGPSTSPWVRTYFCRDTTFDGMTIAPQRFGYHYLTDPSDVNSSPKQNNEVDVFLMNDQTILRALSAQGHGGFMVVLDPEGQILTKSPYIQNCSSISRSINTQTFAGGMYIDGCVGNLQANPVNTSTYFLGTTTIAVTGLSIREPETPCRFIVNGVGYEVDYVQDWSPTSTCTLHLNPLNLGGVAYTNGIIPVANSGTGYTSVPAVQFSSPTFAGGVVAQGTATVVGGKVTQINITNPGSGYDPAYGAPTVTFIGGDPGVPASVTLTTASIQNAGFIGQLPSTIEIGTAGYRSALAADFTQLNDLGYGVVVNNLSFSELVSVFTYFCHAGYYTANGAQIGSSNGATKYGDFAMISNGADPYEVPIPARLVNNMITTATIVSEPDTWGLDTQNTTTDTTLYIKNWSYIPYGQSLITVDHGAAVDSKGARIGVVSYTINNASTVTNTGTIVQLNLSTAGGTLGSLKAPIPNNTPVFIRSNKVFGFSGINTDTITRPSTALTFNESDSITYQVLNYDTSNLPVGNANVTFKRPFGYLNLTPYGALPAIGSTTISIAALSTSTGITDTISDSQRLVNSLASADPKDRYIVGWNDTIHTITGYNWLGGGTATVTISPGLTKGLTTSTDTLYAGLQGARPAEISTRISILRATGHDFVGVGSGGRETSNIPNDIFGPPRIQPSATKEVVEVGKGRVFQTSTDQDGNFRVGDLFSINQGTGAATLNASISLTGVDGLGFSKGVVVDEFSADDNMNPASASIVPVQVAVANHISRRLGLDSSGAPLPLIGSGYLDLTGTQKMKGTLQSGGWSIDMGNFYPGATSQIYNLNTCTLTHEAANKGYVDSVTAPKVNRAGDTMTGNLVLDGDPTTSTSLLRASTRGYVDRVRQLSTLSDVTFTSPADADLLMFSGTTLSVNTTTTRPIWSNTRQVVNVTNSSTSDISVTRVGNSVDFQYRAGSIVNADVNASAAISQSKLAMNTATTRANSSGITQAERGLASFDSNFFSATGGWISFGTQAGNRVLASTGSGAVSWVPYSTIAPSDITGNAATATKLQTARAINGVNFDGTQAISINLVNALSVGSGITTTGSGTFDGSSAVTISVNSTATATPLTVVSRDANADIFARLFQGTATSAYYADLAEIYASDSEYGPGTVVVFGGEKEITQSTEFMDRRIAGVISTNPAHLMNAKAEGLPVALQGRVPCFVTGVVKKGDMLVSSHLPGVAVSSNTPLLGSVIGKALEEWDSNEVGVIEVVVGRI